MGEDHYLESGDFSRAVSSFGSIVSNFMETVGAYEEIVKSFTNAVNKFQEAGDDIPLVIKVEMPKEDD